MFENEVMPKRNAIGRPMTTMVFKISLSNLKYFKSIFTTELVVSSSIKTRTAEIHCETMVAIATPSTPIPKPRTNQISRTAFKTVENTSIIKGFVESPTARIIAAPIL